MKLKTAGISCLLAFGVGVVSTPALAKVSAEQAAQLGGDKYT
ncbi:MAG: hypothetical protein JWR07_991, partial [Nevskia sp.]|nr:hypothetical protein [Nevskia sp.]